MFDVDGFTIRMRRGETGAVKIRLLGYNFAPEDRVIFHVRQGTVTYLKKVYTPDADGAITVYFLHGKTDELAAGNYTYDVIVVLHPYYDESGNISDGDQVLYPYDPQSLVIEGYGGL